MKMDFVELFPVEIIEKILGYLSARELGRCCCVSKTWKLLASSDILWTKLIQEDGFADELLVPLKEKGFSGDILQAGGNKKGFYDRRALALANWKRGEWKEEELTGVLKLESLGNGGLLAVLRLDGTLALYDVEEAGFIQTIKLPKQARDLHGVGTRLFVCSLASALVYHLDGRELQFGLAFIASGGNDRPGLEVTTRIPSPQLPALPEEPSTILTLAHTTETTVVLQRTRPWAGPGLRMYFSLKSGVETRREPLDPDILTYAFHKEFIFKVYRERLVCEEGWSGRRVFESALDSTLVEHYTARAVSANDTVVLLESRTTTGDHFVESWDWSGAVLRWVNFPPTTSLALHPRAPTLIVARHPSLPDVSTLSLVNVRTNYNLATWDLPPSVGRLLASVPLASSSLILLGFASALVLLDQTSNTLQTAVRLDDNTSAVANSKLACILKKGHVASLYIFAN